MKRNKRQQVVPVETPKKESRETAIRAAVSRFDDIAPTLQVEHFTRDRYGDVERTTTIPLETTSSSLLEVMASDEPRNDPEVKALKQAFVVASFNPLNCGSINTDPSVTTEMSMFNIGDNHMAKLIKEPLLVANAKRKDRLVREAMAEAAFKAMAMQAFDKVVNLINVRFAEIFTLGMEGTGMTVCVQQYPTNNANVYPYTAYTIRYDQDTKRITVGPVLYSDLIFRYSNGRILTYQQQQMRTLPINPAYTTSWAGDLIELDMYYKTSYQELINCLIPIMEINTNMLYENAPTDIGRDNADILSAYLSAYNLLLPDALNALENTIYQLWAMSATYSSVAYGYKYDDDDYDDDDY